MAVVFRPRRGYRRTTGRRDRFIGLFAGFLCLTVTVSPVPRIFAILPNTRARFIAHHQISIKSQFAGSAVQDVYGLIYITRSDGGVTRGGDGRTRKTLSKFSNAISKYGTNNKYKTERTTLFTIA